MDESFYRGLEYQEKLNTEFEIQITAKEQRRPSVLLRPSLETYGRIWKLSYGEFWVIGDTPEEAAKIFDKCWTEGVTSDE